MSAFYPIYDSKGNIYTYSLENGIVDKYDKNQKLISTYLDVRLNNNYIYYHPNWEDWDSELGKSGPRREWLKPSIMSCFYDITADEKLFIFLHRSATAYIFEKDKLVRQFPIHIDGALQQYKNAVLNSIEEQKKNNPGNQAVLQRDIFSNCFLDKDAPFFYVQLNTEDAWCSLYQFDFLGNFTQIIDTPGEPAIFQDKRNGLFYAFSIDHLTPLIFKPKQKTK